ncbi:hypothetical protein LUZ60_011385 [Juncus effusus]|nr:hypothetical protein LUZ60_011385 [Juncus effusus]
MFWPAADFLINFFFLSLALVFQQQTTVNEGNKFASLSRSRSITMEITAPSLLLLCISLLVLPLFSAAAELFDVRQHLSTVTRYDASRGTRNAASFSSPIPDGCEPIHLNLVSRHGTRLPTKKRMKELDRLSLRLQILLKEKPTDSCGIPEWMKGWESPWKGREKGGELLGLGEEELYRLALRVRERFAGIFGEEYHPDVYPIKATQVPRASVSAMAFGLGLFSRKGNIGPGKNRAFSVISENRAIDIHLRFFESCKTYKEYKKSQKPAVEKSKEPILDEITSALFLRHRLNFSLWFLCKQEASLLDVTDQACGLFNQTEIELLEWTDDLEVFILKGYGKSINYRMGVPLLKDIFLSMEQAIITKQEKKPGWMFERARLRFAHAETIVPFSCLLGLFLDGSEFEKIQREEKLSVPPKPPQKRNWKGSFVAPFAGNNMLVLYQCGAKSGKNASYFVQVLHNEVPVPLPACGNSDFCPFEDFKESVVEPHLKHEFDIICAIKEAVQDPIVEVPKPSCSAMCKFRNFIGGFLLLSGSNAGLEQKDAEL